MCTFEGTERSIHNLMLSFFSTLFEQENALGVSTLDSLHDLIDFCTSLLVSLYFLLIL